MEEEIMDAGIPEEIEVSQYPKYWLPDGVYKALKWICLVGLPAIAVGYQIVADIWGLPYLEQVPQTMSGIALIVGLMIGVSEIKGK